MTVTTIKSPTLDDVTESNESYLDKVVNRIATRWRGKKVAALTAWHEQEIKAELETLQHRHNEAIAHLEKEHREALQAQKDSWILNQKLRQTAHVHGQHGNLVDMEERRFITTTVSPEGFVEWTIRQND